MVAKWDLVGRSLVWRLGGERQVFLVRMCARRGRGGKRLVKADGTSFGSC